VLLQSVAVVKVELQSTMVYQPAVAVAAVD
jgi:hypothetical protein